MYKIIKKMLCYITFVTLLSTNFGYAFAANSLADSPLDSTISYGKCTVTLTGPNGTRYKVQAFEVPQTRTESIDGNISKTFTYSLENKYMQLDSATTRGGQSNDEWDDSISVHGYITINYNTTTLSNGLKGYRLTSVTGKWEKSDNYVTMSNKRVAYTCQDINNLQQITLKYPSANSFSYSTGYSFYVSDAPTGVMGANSHVDLNHAGSGTWSLDVTCNYFDNNILELL